MALAVAPNGQSFWVLEAGGTLASYYIANFQAAPQITVGTVGGTPNSLVITKDGQFGYVGEANGYVIEVSLLQDISLGAISVSGSVNDLAISPNGTILYVADATNKDVVPIQVINGVPGTPIILSDAPSTIAVSPDGQVAYVGSSDGTITCINLIKATVSIASTGSSISSVDVSPNGALIVAAQNLSNKALIYSSSSMTLQAQLTVGSNPVAIGITPDQPPHSSLSVSVSGVLQPVTFNASASTVPFGTITAYYFNFGDGSTLLTTNPQVTHTYTGFGNFEASVIEVSSGGTSTSFVYDGAQAYLNGNNTAVAYASVSFPIPTYAYVTDSTGNEISVISTHNNSLATNIALSNDPIRVVVNPNNLSAEVLTQANFSLNSILTQSNSIGSSISLGTNLALSSVAVANDGQYAYIASSNPSEIIPVNLTNSTVLTPITVSGSVSRVITDSADQFLYALVPSASEIVPIAIATAKVLPPIKTCSNPSSEEIVSGTIYVTCSSSATLQALNATTGALITQISVGAGPIEVVANMVGELFVLNAGSDSVSIVSSTLNSVTGTLALPSTIVPVAEAVLGSKTLYVVNGNSSPSVVPVDLVTQQTLPQISLPSGSVPTDISLVNAVPGDYSAFVSGNSSSSVVPIDTSSQVVGKPFRCWCVAFIDCS